MTTHADTSGASLWYPSNDWTVGIGTSTRKSKEGNKLTIEEKVYDQIKRCRSPRGKPLSKILGYLYHSYVQIPDAIKRLEKKELIEEIENSRWVVKSESFLNL